MLKKYLIILFLIFAQPSSAGIPVLTPCSRSDNLIAYLGSLFEQKIIGADDIHRFKISLGKDELENPMSEVKTGSSNRIHRVGIANLLVDIDANDRQDLLALVEKFLTEKEHQHTTREEVRIKTQDLYYPMEFHPVPAGSFEMGEGDYKVKVNLTHRTEVMSVPVTQYHWVKEMGENPSHFIEGENSIMINVNGKIIKLQPDNPVESITWWSALVFANKLSKKHGLKPAYDLSDIKFKATTSAEDGTLDHNSGKLKVNGPDIYLTEGFRLPTEAEQEYVLRGAGIAKGSFHFGDNEAELKDFAWYLANSNGATHPVAELKPLMIGGKKFFDVSGNVYEWGYDEYTHVLKGGNNPAIDQVAPVSSRVIRGGSWGSDPVSLRSAVRHSFSHSLGLNHLGFRLVRTLP